MELKNLIDITPEIKAEAQQLFESTQKLKGLIRGRGHFELSAYSSTPNVITIYDRYEYSGDGEHVLGFYVHRLYDDGTYQLDFINEDTKEGRAFDEAFNKYMEEGQDGED